MMRRNPDGTWRNSRKAAVVSMVVIRARWIEAETIHLKRMGLSFDAIAEQITRIGRGSSHAITPLPPGVTFPQDFGISRQAVHKAFRRAIAREPAVEVEELRKLDHARSEDLFLNLQPAVRKGNPRAIEAALKVLDHGAKIQGYGAPQRHELTGRDGTPLTLLELLAAVGPMSDKSGK